MELEKKFNSDEYFSALKRKNIKDILMVTLNILGETAAAAELDKNSRMTNATFDRVRALFGTTLDTPVEEEKFEEPLPEFDEVMEEADNELLAIHTDIENLLAKGKGKKALKLIKASMANGTKGSVIKEQLAKAKQLKKEAK